MLEQPGGSSRFARNKNDFQKVSSIISELEKDSGHSSSIRDCHRLGKYANNSPRPRPLLVSLNSTADVYNILSKRHNSPSPITIKPDLSPTNRKIEALLLKERWRLIESGVDRRHIKIRGSNIYLNDQLHGKIIESELSLVSNPMESSKGVNHQSSNTQSSSFSVSQVPPSNVHGQSSSPSVSQVQPSIAYGQSRSSSVSQVQPCTTPTPPSLPLSSTSTTD